MVALNTVLIVGTLTFGGGVLMTVLIGLLIAIYRNTKKDNEDEGGIYTIPASALMRGPAGPGVPGGGMDGLMQLYHAAQAANAAEKEEGKKDKDEKIPGGNYL